MRAIKRLPPNCKKILEINLQKNKKTALAISLAGTGVMLAVFAAGLLFAPIGAFFEERGLTLRLLALALGYIAYIVLHELTHAAVMRACGGGRVVFGFTGLYAFAGSREDYFDRRAYRRIALAPVIVWGVAFFALSACANDAWFWVFWFLQAGNIGGSVGDIFVTARLARLPDTIRIRDTGLDVTVYDA